MDHCTTIGPPKPPSRKHEPKECACQNPIPPHIHELMNTGTSLSCNTQLYMNNDKIMHTAMQSQHVVQTTMHLILLHPARQTLTLAAAQLLEYLTVRDI